MGEQRPWRAAGPAAGRAGRQAGRVIEAGKREKRSVGMICLSGRYRPRLGPASRGFAKGRAVTVSCCDARGRRCRGMAICLMFGGGMAAADITV